MSEQKRNDGERPPVKRLRLALWLHADDLDDLVRELRFILDDIEYQNRDERNCTGGGYHFEIDVTDPDMTPDRYMDELHAWIDQRKLSRRAAVPSSSEG